MCHFINKCIFFYWYMYITILKQTVFEELLQSWILVTSIWRWLIGFKSDKFLIVFCSPQQSDPPFYPKLPHSWGWRGCTLPLPCAHTLQTTRQDRRRGGRKCCPLSSLWTSQPNLASKVLLGTASFTLIIYQMNISFDKKKVVFIEIYMYDRGVYPHQIKLCDNFMYQYVLKILNFWAYINASFQSNLLWRLSASILSETLFLSKTLLLSKDAPGVRDTWVGSEIPTLLSGLRSGVDGKLN